MIVLIFKFLLIIITTTISIIIRMNYEKLLHVKINEQIKRMNDPDKWSNKLADIRNKWLSKYFSIHSSLQIKILPEDQYELDRIEEIKQQTIKRYTDLLTKTKDYFKSAHFKGTFKESDKEYESKCNKIITDHELFHQLELDSNYDMEHKMNILIEKKYKERSKSLLKSCKDLELNDLKQFLNCLQEYYIEECRH